MTKKSKILVETDGTKFSDELTSIGNTSLRMELEKDTDIYNLCITVSSRIDTDNYTTIKLFGVSPNGIKHIIKQLNEVRNVLEKDLKSVK